MTDELLRDLARRAGISVEWQDYTGRVSFVEPPTLQSLLAALGLPAGTSRDLSASRKLFNRRNRVVDLPPLLTGVAGRPTRLEVSGTDPMTAELLLETSETRPLTLSPTRGRLRIPPIQEPGYHRLSVKDRQIVLAIAPPRCRTVEDAVPDARLWGLAANFTGPLGIGNLGGALPIIQAAAPLGADALALCYRPTGVTSAEAPTGASGSRLFSDPAIAAPALVFDGSTTPIPGSDSQGRDNALRGLFDAFLDGADWNGPLGADFSRFRYENGMALLDHARFITIAETSAAATPSSWQSWPLDLRDPRSPAVAAFAAAHKETVLFHEFLQWLADRSKAAVQTAARQAGMRIGLMTHLPLGVPEDGSEVWSQQSSMMLNASMGAAPAADRPGGEIWNQSGFSPRALESSGYAAFITMLRAVMRNTGGVNLSHATGLARQWLIPAGGAPAEGAYITYPVTDLLRLIALESVRHQTIVAAEVGADAPVGFTEMLEQTAIHTTRVLVPDRGATAWLGHPDAWTSDNIGLTSSPGGPSVREWWATAPPGDATALWDFVGESGSTRTPQPAPDAPDGVVDAAIGFLGRTSVPLALVPLHDMVDASTPGVTLDQPEATRRFESLASLRPRY
jgi:4-alpha-glucanotransferase